jgi:holliday junction DNA helicase RuvA
MIAKIKGKIIENETGSLIVDVSGMGYRVFISNNTMSDIGSNSEVKLWTHLVVRENLLDLYGFSNKDEKRFFELLIGISGIGPKGALAILSLAPVATLQKAIVSEDATYLTKVSGIGKKSAQKIILELKDKVSGGSSEDGIGLKEEAEVIEALQALGYTLHDSREALKNVSGDTSGTNERIKEALKILGNT